MNFVKKFLVKKRTKRGLKALKRVGALVEALLVSVLDLLAGL